MSCQAIGDMTTLRRKKKSKKFSKVACGNVATSRRQHRKHSEYGEKAVGMACDVWPPITAPVRAVCGDGRWLGFVGGAGKNKREPANRSKGLTKASRRPHCRRPTSDRVWPSSYRLPCCPDKLQRREGLGRTLPPPVKTQHPLNLRIRTMPNPRSCRRVWNAAG
jgi:hypothetical protein